jgi:hypothetical protein
MQSNYLISRNNIHLGIMICNLYSAMNNHKDIICIRRHHILDTGSDMECRHRYLSIVLKGMLYSYLGKNSGRNKTDKVNTIRFKVQNSHHMWCIWISLANKLSKNQNNPYITKFYQLKMGMSRMDIQKHTIFC